MRNVPTVAFLALSLSTAAFGSDKASLPAPSAFGPVSTIFNKLSRLFDEGVAPAFDIGAHAFSGRCFDPSHENAVKGAAYGVRVYDATPDDGPLGERKIGYSVVSIWSNTLAYYDSHGVEQVMGAGKAYDATNLSGSLDAPMESIRSYLRRNGEYLIEAITEKGVTTYLCYYYIPLVR